MPVLVLLLMMMTINDVSKHIEHIGRQTAYLCVHQMKAEIDRIKRDE
jgi:hypothetical protein